MQLNESSKFQTPIARVQELNWEVKAQLEVNYRVTMTRGLLNPADPAFAQICGVDGSKQSKRLVVIDSVVLDLYKEKLNTYFAAWNILPVWKIITGNEETKTMKQALSVAEAMTEAGLLRRTEAVIAIGGGVVLDIVGFAASLYRRGIPYIRIPTTLMGQVDAGIGIKTGVNFGHHKNRLGTYFAPVAALIDPEFLLTLDQRHIANGVAEIIKMALIKDKTLFQLLEKEVNNLNPRVMACECPRIKEIFSRAIAGMLDELEPNLWEATLERSVDYGHTFSPSLELIANPALLHGEAVAIDMALSIALALYRDLISIGEAERALNLINQAGLPLIHQDFTPELIEKALDDSVKHRDGFQRVPLTAGIGNVTFVNDLTKAELNTALQYVQQYMSRIYQQREAV
jgi:3-dehydroquinate synthase